MILYLPFPIVFVFKKKKSTIKTHYYINGRNVCIISYYMLLWYHKWTMVGIWNKKRNFYKVKKKLICFKKENSSHLH